MTDADNKMSVNLHENGKQQESQQSYNKQFCSCQRDFDNYFMLSVGHLLPSFMC